MKTTTIHTEQQTSEKQATIEQYLLNLQKAAEITRYNNPNRAVELIGDAVEVSDTIGLVLQEHGEFGKAERYMLEILSTAQRLEITEVECAVMNAMGRMYEDIGDYEHAIEHYGNAMWNAREKQNESLEGRAQMNIARSCQKLGHYERALPYFFFAIEHFVETADVVRQILCYCGVSEAFLSLGNQLAAIDNIEQGRLLSEGLQDTAEQQIVAEEIRLMQEKIDGVENAGQAWNSNHRAAVAQISAENGGEEMSKHIKSTTGSGDAERENQLLREQLDELKGHLREQTMKNVQKQEALETATKILSHEIARYENKTLPKLREVILVLKSADDKGVVWRAYEQELERQSPNFTKRLHDAYPTLSRAEIRICSLLAAQMSSKNVAAMLFLDKKTIDKHRQNIRKKMGLPSNVDLALHLALFRA